MGNIYDRKVVGFYSEVAVDDLREGVKDVCHDIISDYIISLAGSEDDLKQAMDSFPWDYDNIDIARNLEELMKCVMELYYWKTPAEDQCNEKMEWYGYEQPNYYGVFFEPTNSDEVDYEPQTEEEEENFVRPKPEYDESKIREVYRCYSGFIGDYLDHYDIEFGIFENVVC